MRRLGTLGLTVACALSLGAVSCSKKKRPKPPPPELTGLAAVPATAQVVIAADVSKLASAPIVVRAVEQLLLKDAVLAQRWHDVATHCKLDLTTQVRHVMLALGPPAAAAAAGSGPVLMVATGSLAEADLVACIPKIVGGGGGGLSTKDVAGRTLYQVKDGNRVMYFAFGRPDTVVLGTDDAWVLDALGPGPKALDQPDLAGWIGQVDQKAPLWAVGRVEPRVGQGLVAASGGQLTQPPQAIIGTIDPRDGARLALAVQMATPELASALESFAKTELAVVGMAAQLKSLGSIVAKIKVAVDGRTVRFNAALTQPEINQLLSVLDATAAPEQVTPPPAN